MDDERHFWSGRTVALTGATGFVGHHLATRLVQLGARVVALVRATSQTRRLTAAGVRCVVAELGDLVALVRGCTGCEFVFHLAGAVDFKADWERFRQVNVAGTANVVRAVRAAGVRRLVHTSSIVAVGATPWPAALDEEFAWNLGPVRVPYVSTKREAEELVLAEARQGLEAVVVNPASVIGPDDFSASEFGTLCRRFWRGRIPFHFGGGNNFVDVRDVVCGHLRAAQHGQPGQRYILGGHNRSYTAFFAELARVAPRPIVRLRLPDVVGEVVAAIGERLSRRGSRSYLTAGQVRLLSLFFWVDSGKAARELGYRPRPFRTTVADTYRFWMGRRPQSAGSASPPAA